MNTSKAPTLQYISNLCSHPAAFSWSTVVCEFCSNLGCGQCLLGPMTASLHRSAWLGSEFATLQVCSNTNPEVRILGLMQVGLGVLL
jgi:hypothetical protein